jgi:hypothetical protein
MKILLSLLLLLPMISSADSPFAGQWVMKPERTTFSMRTTDLLIERNLYRLSSCGDALEAPTDGIEHPVSGWPTFDTLSVRIVDRRKVEITQKLAGKMTWKGVYTVSRDQRLMTLQFEDDRPVNAVIGTLEYARVGEPLSGAHSLSGSWRPQKLTRLSPTGLSMHIEDLEKGLAIRWSDGRSVDTNLDARHYPLNGYLAGATISVLRSRPDTLAINRFQNAAPVEVSRAVLSEDAQTMTYVQVDWQCRTEVIFSYGKEAESQPSS